MLPCDVQLVASQLGRPALISAYERLSLEFLPGAIACPTPDCPFLCIIADDHMLCVCTRSFNYSNARRSSRR
jgi:hypothetical protein